MEPKFYYSSQNTRCGCDMQINQIEMERTIGPSSCIYRQHNYKNDEKLMEWDDIHLFSSQIMGFNSWPLKVTTRLNLV